MKKNGKALPLLAFFALLSFSLFGQGITTRATLKTYFETGDRPTQSQYYKLIDSYFHLLDDSLAITKLAGVDELSDDGTLAGANSRALVTERAVKTYIDAVISAGEILMATTLPVGNAGYKLAIDTVGTVDSIYINNGYPGTANWKLFAVTGGGGGSVASVFGRTGTVTAATSDYDAIQIDNTPAGNISATNVQAALNELDAEKLSVEVDGSTTNEINLDNHTGDIATAQIENGAVTLAKQANGTANRLQGWNASGSPSAISVSGNATLSAGVLNVTGDGTGTDDQIASEVNISPSITGITATTVQGALAEHQADIDALASGGGDGVLNGVTVDGPNQQVDFSVAAPGTSVLNVDFSAFATDAEVTAAGYLTSEVDGSTTNELQTISNTSNATSHTVTLSNSGGSVQLVEGSNITLTTGGTGSAGTVTIASTATDDQIASEVNISPSITGITATTVQGALAEHQADIDALASGAGDGVATAGAFDDANNEIDVTVAAPGSSFSINLQPVLDSAYNWNLLKNVPAGFADGVDNVDDADASATNEIQTLAQVLAEGNSAGAKIANLTDPTLAQDAATKAYVDNQTVTMSGGNNYLQKQTATNTLGNSQIYENGTSVGVGLTSSTEKLEVEGDIKIRGTNSLHFSNTSDQVYIKSPSSNILTFSTSNTEAMRVNASGNVGIGTNLPGEKLEVNGQVKVVTEAYGVTWNGSLTVPTKDAVYDKIETVIGGAADGVATAGTFDDANNEIDITVTGGSNFSINLQPVLDSAYNWNLLKNVPAGFADGVDNVDDADASPTNELQTISKTGSTVTLSNGGGSFTDAVDDADASATNELQTISNTSNATSHTVTLSNSGGSVQLIEGSNITLTTGGTGSAGTVTIAATGDGTGTDDQTAAEVPNTPSGNISATNVQAALNELDTEKLAKSVGTFEATTNYQSDGSPLEMMIARGTIASPTSDYEAVIAVQKTSNATATTGTTDANPTAYFSAKKTVSSVNSRAVALFAEGEDVAGDNPANSLNSYVEGVRGHGVVTGGKHGSGYGVVGLAGTSTGRTARYLVGVESYVKDNGPVAPAILNRDSFSVGFLATNASSNVIDAGFLTNPYSTAKHTVGYLVGPQSVLTSAFASYDTTVVGLDLGTRGKQSFASIVMNGPMRHKNLLTGTGTVELFSLNNSNDLIVGTGNNHIVFNAPGSTGYVGVRETTPTSPLHVLGETADNTKFAMTVNASSGAVLFRTRNDGLFEIGGSLTSNPSLPATGAGLAYVQGGGVKPSAMKTVVDNTWRNMVTNPSSITTVSANYSILPADNTLIWALNSFLNPVTLTLPSPASAGGGRWYIIDPVFIGNAMSVTSAAGTIDGKSSLPLTDTRHNFIVYTDGAGWHTVGYESERDTIYAHIQGADISTSVNVAGELKGHITVPQKWAGYAFASATWGAYAAGGGSGSTTVKVSEYTPSRSFGGYFADATFSPGTNTVTSTTGTYTATSGDLLLIDVTAHNMTTSMEGLSVTIMLVK